METKATYNPEHNAPVTKAQAIEYMKYTASHGYMMTSDVVKRVAGLMSGEIPEFHREERYVVIKLKDLKERQRMNLTDWLRDERIPLRKAAVVEADWPEYNIVWKMIEDRVMSGN